MTVNRDGISDNEYSTADDVRPSKLQILTDKVDQLEGVVDKLERRLFDLENKIGEWPIPEFAEIDFGDGTLKNACQVCGIEWSGTMGYCCSRADCPFGGATCVDFPLGLNTGG